MSLGAALALVSADLKNSDCDNDFGLREQGPIIRICSIPCPYLAITPPSLPTPQFIWMINPVPMIIGGVRIFFTAESARDKASLVIYDNMCVDSCYFIYCLLFCS